jgi:hypothetical protein
MSTTRLTWLSFALVAGFAQTAAAHVDVLFPADRGGDQKTGPCEGKPLVGGDPVTVRRPGSVLTVRLDETIAHPGHFRIMFDADVTDGEDFPVPNDCDDVGTPDGETLLADDLLKAPSAPGKACSAFDSPGERTPGGTYSVDVTLPDVECENCALQVIQVMTDKAVEGAWSNAGGAGLYFRCSNMRLSATEAETPDTGATPDPDDDGEPDDGGDDDAGGGDDSDGDDTGGASPAGGCTTGGTAPLGAGVFLAALLLGRRRRASSRR